MAELLAEVIQPAGSVTICHSAEEALARCRHFPGEFDLALIDMNLPDARGVTIVRELCELSPSTLLFLMSGGIEGEELAAAMNTPVEGFIRKPFLPGEVRHRIEHALERRSRLSQQWQILEDYEIGLHQRTRSLRRAQQATLLALAKLAESRDPETGRHVDRVAVYCRTVADWLRGNGHFTDVLSDEYVENLFLTSPLHDIGKVGIPDEVLLKPGRLTPDEFEVMKTHTLIGSRVLDSAMEMMGEASSMLAMAREIVRSHHERWDGKGYPDGLESGRIPLAARIVTVVDNYDALRTRRVYKPAFSQKETRTIMRNNAGGQFDPLLLHALEACDQRLQLLAHELDDTEDEQDDTATQAASA